MLDKRRYRESYVHGELRESSSTPSTFHNNKSPLPKTAMGNRYSVISDASSNTTSGIASDKMTVSFEENEGMKFNEVDNKEIKSIGCLIFYI